MASLSLSSSASRTPKVCSVEQIGAAERLVLGDFAVGSGIDERSDLARNLMRVPGLFDVVKAQLDKAEARSTSILKASRTMLDRIAARLDAEGYISAAEIENIKMFTHL